MFSLVRGLYSSIFADDTRKVLIVGLESSGKTTLSEQLKHMYATESSKNGANSSTTEENSGDATASEVNYNFPTPAPVESLRKKIRPTTGLNRSSVTHVTTPPQHETPNVSLTPLTTPLILWDIGGSLRPLWGNFFGTCHGVIFVVDSTLGEATSNGCSEGGRNTSPDQVGTSEDDESDVGAQPNSPIGDVREGERSQFLRKLYAKDALILRQMFSHPLLAGAPLLIVSNKVDAANHHTLVEIQDALRLVDVALMDEFYADDCVVGEPVYGELHRNGEGDYEGPPDRSAYGKLSNEKSFGGVATPPPGSSGIGNRVMRLVEMSALHGTGVVDGMNWLVAQMRDSGRQPLPDDGK
ncbi:hypothetical protein, conserved [Trypanosoma brucei gambiense DAL972]|uniref:ADP-ribosylation factor-like protein n=2 Tax=Trypanosoma brucei TaxID=5691 RepID=C9ZX62_TRYB9|nr:hypothetical protein, conserved [Trypanosoma brucei gambiense DAL972]RHW67321.1 ADP-ribosylation factor family [Trypanosoma brucei equiperdum]CBH14004.1 hypothetical protein, conserved [Trypanosoma brucei gambiense DAL972]|eukprot:XP_011776277.1 hypothetical protein, conserved [Trypanosoma brucei gambiense DAL972]